MNHDRLPGMLSRIPFNMQSHQGMKRRDRCSTLVHDRNYRDPITGESS